MIYCIGDSFTYGDELANRHTSAWPAILEKKLNCPIWNLGKSGASSQYVLKKSIECVYKGDADLIIVAWPGYNRAEYFTSNKIQEFWPGRDLSSVNGEVENQLVKILTHEHNYNMDLWNYRNWLLNTILLQTFFQANNQKYIMLQTY